MELKNYFIGEFTKYSEIIKNSLRILEKIDVDDADYKVNIHSSWGNEGEKDITTEHHGSLKEAIQKAEQEFKEINHREDIQGRYNPYIVLGDKSFYIPEMFWEGYTKH